MRRIVVVTLSFATGVIGGLVAPRLASLGGQLIARQITHLEPLSPAVWAARVEQFQLLDPTTASPSLVYVGDSVTDYANVQEFVNFEGGVVLNRAIQGDTSGALHERLKRTLPQGSAVVILLIGYNNLIRGADPSEIAADVEATCDFLIKQRSVLHVAVESLLPAADDRKSHLVKDLNARLHQIAASRNGVSYLDLYPLFSSEGRQNASLFVDSVHLNATGVLRRARAEVDHLRRVLPEIGNQLTIVSETKD